MADVNKFSERLIDVAERFADMVDAAEGRGARKSRGGTRWLVLPAAGAAVYALATSSSAMARQTRGLMRRAKDRASDLPDAVLFNRVKEVTGLADEPAASASASGSRTRSSSSSSTRRRRSTRTTKSGSRRTTTASR
jgi:hypothetical protein